MYCTILCTVLYCLLCTVLYCLLCCVLYYTVYCVLCDVQYCCTVLHRMPAEEQLQYTLTAALLVTLLAKFTSFLSPEREIPGLPGKLKPYTEVQGELKGGRK